MSKTSIPQKVKAELWWRSAGRCEFRGCNKPLDVNGVTFENCDISNCAHIIADSANGPRGDKILSPELAKDPNNIMLMCPECHKYIDHEGKGIYSAETLFAMKQRHENRMRYLTGLTEDLQAHIVTFGAKIGDHEPDFSITTLQQALLPDFYPESGNIIDLGGRWYGGENWDDFWQSEVKNLEYNCRDKVLDRFDRWENKRIALFGFAPMPLLVKLGTLLNNKHEVEVFQKQRRGGWAWPSSEEKSAGYILKRPEDTTKSPVLILSLSFDISGRVRNNIANIDSSIWELTIAQPNPEFLVSKSLLYEYGRTIENLLNEIVQCSSDKPLNLYLSVPVACAIEFGRVWMQKANSSLKIYDYNRRHSDNDMLALTIQN